MLISCNNFPRNPAGRKTNRQTSRYFMTFWLPGVNPVIKASESYQNVVCGAVYGV